MPLAAHVLGRNSTADIPFGIAALVSLSKMGKSMATDTSKSSDTLAAIADTGRKAVDSAKQTVNETLDRGQAALSQTSAAASDMAEAATQQVKTIASEVGVDG